MMQQVGRSNLSATIISFPVSKLPRYYLIGRYKPESYIWDLTTGRKV